MQRYVAVCPACDWETPASDDREDLEIAAAEHLDGVHGPAVIAGTSPEVRFHSFQGMTATALHTEIAERAEPEPPPPTPPAPERPREHETSRGEKPRRKG